MKIRGTSHIAIGVSNMARSLHFYRDLLGLKVTRDDPNEDPGGKGKRTRHGVYLRWEDGPDASFIVLSEDRPSWGQALKVHQIGIHHFAFWVDDLEATFETIKAAGVPVLVPPTLVDSVGYGEAAGQKILTTLFKDPDGTVIQLDQRV